jgi:hypothetical protein
MKLTALHLTARRFLYTVCFRVILQSFTTKCLSPPVMGPGRVGGKLRAMAGA